MASVANILEDYSELTLGVSGIWTKKLSKQVLKLSLALLVPVLLRSVIVLFLIAPGRALKSQIRSPSKDSGGDTKSQAPCLPFQHVPPFRAVVPKCFAKFSLKISTPAGLVM